MTKTKIQTRKRARGPTAESCRLTGLPCGQSGRTLLAAELGRCLARGDAAALALVDVDEFRDVNRMLGPERADAVLKTVARRLVAALPQRALAMRLAGDCFGVLLPKVEPDDALIAMQRVRAAIGRTPVVTGKGARRREAHPTVSVGIVGAPRDGDSFDAVLVPAQAALRRAKALGRDRVASRPEDKMVLKSSYYPQSQLERLKQLAARLDVAEAVVLREALEDILLKHKDRPPPRT
jgi:diguanylate cyclase (GGDEF)-like protein